MKQKILHCNFCGSTASSFLYKDNPHLVVCGNCGLIYTNTQMTIQGMKGFYDDDYFISKDSVSKGYKDYFDDKKNITTTFYKRLDLIAKYSKSPGKLLDVGCAAGFFLEVARKKGWDVYGLDISEICSKYAREKLGIKVENGLLINTTFEDSTFDLITMWDYLEHSITPKQDIEKAQRLLRKDGLLAIATPDISSVPARICESRWIGIKLEEHFYYFSKKVLSKLLENSGFEVLRVGYIGKYISSHMIADRLGYYNRLLSNMFGGMLKRAKFSFYCNPFDILFIICRKK